MSGNSRLLDLVSAFAEDGKFEAVLATTFTFDADFFVFSGVLPALAGHLTRERGDHPGRRRVSAEVVRDALGNPFVGVLTGYPSHGPPPPWIDRYLWPTRRLGIQHAKCLLVTGQSRMHALVTSANLTEGSWCRNIEVAAVWSAPRRPATLQERQSAQAIIEIADGLRLLAEAVNAKGIIEAAAEMARPLPQPATASPPVVWSGKPFGRRPLEALDAGDEVVVTSPFWPGEESGCNRLLTELRRLAPRVVLAGRAVPGTATLELPEPMAEAARGVKCELQVAQAPDDVDAPVDPGRRLLHAKQISVRTNGKWRSYIGSANATPQGLALQGLPNIELGIMADIGQLLSGEIAAGTRPPPVAPDPDDPGSILGSAGSLPFADLYAAAFLGADSVLNLLCEPTPADGTILAVPTGGPIHALNRVKEQRLDIGGELVGWVLRRPEVTLITPLGDPYPVPVVIDETLKLVASVSVDGEATNLDLILDELRRNPLRRPSDDADTNDEDLAGQTVAGAAEPSRPVVPRRPVHRAREMVEVITAAAVPLREFLGARPEPPTRLIRLRLGGAGSIIDLARRLASTAGTDTGVSVTAAAFGTVEIERLLSGCSEAAPAAAAATVAELSAEVARLTDGLLRQVDSATAKRLRALRREA